jgi:hypothetical protein
MSPIAHNRFTAPHPLIGLDDVQVVGQAHGVEADEAEVGPPGRRRPAASPARTGLPSTWSVKPPSSWGHRVDRGTGEHGDALVGERLGEHLGGLGLLDRDQAVGHLDDVTSTPYRAKTCANSQPIGPRRARPATRAGRSRSPRHGWSRYGVPSRPSIGGRGRAGAGVEHHALAGDSTSCRPTRTRPARPARRGRGGNGRSAVLEALDRARRPSRRWPRPDPGGRRSAQSGSTVGAATEPGDLAAAAIMCAARSSSSRERSRSTGTRRRRDGPRSRRRRAGAGQLDGGMLAAGAEAEHDDVALDVPVIAC